MKSRWLSVAALLLVTTAVLPGSVGATLDEFRRLPFAVQQRLAVQKQRPDYVAMTGPQRVLVILKFRRDRVVSESLTVYAADGDQGLLEVAPLVRDFLAQAGGDSSLAPDADRVGQLMAVSGGSFDLGKGLRGRVYATREEGRFKYTAEVWAAGAGEE